jgi:uncharacterized membrane protein YhaH (DUF805 family)
MSQPPTDATPELPEQHTPSQEPAAPEAPETPQAPQIDAPPALQAPNYAPQPPHFSAPQEQQAPQAPYFSSAPQQPLAPQVPQAPQYGVPGQPAAPQYLPPQAPQYGAPGQPTYAQPAYGQQHAPQYSQPAAPQYAAPVYAAQPVFAPAPIGTVPGPGGYFDGASDPEDLSRPLYGASFMQATKRFFKSYAKFSGRASRSEYWWVTLFVFLIELVPLVLLLGGAIIMAATSTYDPYTYETTSPNGFGLLLVILGYALLIIIGLALLIPSIAITWRRLHDGNFAGPFYFLGLIPYVGALVLLVFTVLPSKAEGRRFDAELR